ncbi:MAG: 16S rRNA (guanine(527)-N(7))-methyltransferase RsmG [Holosporales bacterium]|jgi:16S rRNA (guanine527-N7)-methyltransferase|nr:16S rRNA (guanine(527)-N(7))-methyltransferase RsmG [Holosporales bacterium]
MDAYMDMLKQWNKRINLVQKETIGNMLARHILDSKRVGDLLEMKNMKGNKIIDIGSGAGFPGMVLAISGFENVTLCEKNIKKVAFLRTVREKLHINVNIFCEDVYKITESGYISVSRAFGSLSKLLDVMLAIGSSSGFFHKGKNYKKEIEEARKNYNFEYGFNEMASGEGGIVFVQNISRRVAEPLSKPLYNKISKEKI